MKKKKTALIKSRQWLACEFAFIFIFLPVFFYFYATRWNIHTALWIIACYSLIVLATLSVPAGAHVRAHHNTPSVPPDARASAMPASKVSPIS